MVQDLFFLWYTSKNDRVFHCKDWSHFDHWLMQSISTLTSTDSSYSNRNFLPYYPGRELSDFKYMCFPSVHFDRNSVIKWKYGHTVNCLVPNLQLAAIFAFPFYLNILLVYVLVEFINVSFVSLPKIMPRSYEHE